MKILSKRVLFDERGRPVEVRIDYEEFLRLERVVEGVDAEDNSAALMAFAGTVDWGEDGLEFQRRLRQEWP